MTFQISDFRFKIQFRLRRTANELLRPAVFSFVLLTSTTAAAAPEVIDRVLAVAAGNLIMMSDVRAARDFGFVSSANAADPVREVLSRLIDRALVLAEVDRYAPPEPAAGEVDRALQAVRRRFASPKDYQATLDRDGIAEKHLRETLRDELRIEAYLDQRFIVAPPGDDDLGRYYRDHPESFTRNGVLASFDQVQQDVRLAVVADRRRSLVEDWMAGLRRRAEIIDLYRP